MIMNVLMREYHRSDNYIDRSTGSLLKISKLIISAMRSRIVIVFFRCDPLFFSPFPDADRFKRGKLRLVRPMKLSSRREEGEVF